MLTLRPYQQEAVAAIYEHLRTRDDNPCAVLPTGSGKTAILAQICSDTTEKWHGRILVLSHVKELLEQAAAHLASFLPINMVGLHSAGLGRRDVTHPVIVAGIQTVAAKAGDLGAFDLIIVDECHLIPEAGEGRYLTFLRDAKIVNPAVRVIGLTATPFRLGTGMVCRSGNIMNHICYEANVKELILAGWLSPLRTRQGGEVANLSGVKIASTGDFDASEMQDAFAAITAAACMEITELCRDRRSALVFAAGARHAGLVAATLGGEIVTGDTPKEERASIISRFRAGRVKYLVNVNVLTTGFDAPNVDAVVLLRATMSAGLYCQMVGRGLRKSPGKADCLVLDYGGNAVRHGPIDRIEVVDKKKKSSSAEDAPGKLCPNCREVISVQYRVCPVCAFEFPAREKPRHEARASDAAVISGEAEAKTEAVCFVRYYEHSKIKEDGTSVTMRVEYVLSETMHRTVMEFICFDHPAGGYARRRAEAWWRERSAAPVPATVMDAVAMARRGALAVPVSITTIREAGEKYARIVGYDMGEIPHWEAPEDDGDFFAAETVGAADANDMPF